MYATRSRASGSRSTSRSVRDGTGGVGSRQEMVFSPDQTADHGIKQRDKTTSELKLGTWVDNQRRRAAALTPERVEQLSKVGMRWA